MIIATTIVFFVIIFDHLHLIFPPGFDGFYMILFRNIIIALLCIYSFTQAKKSKINKRSILAVGVVFSLLSLVYYMLWWSFDINTLYIYPVSLVGCTLLFLFNTFKKYEFKSDKIIDNNIYLCFWPPKNARTIFPSLFGQAVGSISIYAGGNLYGPKWTEKKFIKREASIQKVEETFIIFDTRVGFSLEINEELEKLKNCSASIGKFSFLRVKCVYAIKDVLSLLGKEFKPVLLEFIPSHYAKKIWSLKNER